MSGSTVRGQNVYVWSFDGSIEQYTGTGETYIGNTGSSLDGPVGLAVDGQGYLYSGNPSNSSVTKYAGGGVSSLFSNQSDSISGLGFNDSGVFYGTDANYSTIVSGPGLTTDVADGNHSKIAEPFNIAFDGQGNIYVANNGDNFESNTGFQSSGIHGPVVNTIEEFSPTGQDIRTVATGLDDPYGLAFDASGNLFVSNVGNNTIYEFYSGGGGRIFADSLDNLSDPEGLAFDSDGNLYVANAGNGTIEEVFGPGADYSIFASGLDAPASIAISDLSLPASIPEPSAWALILGSLGSLVILRRSRWLWIG
jgi:hypothetical protein